MTGSGDPLDIFWFLPTHGDGRWLGVSDGARPPEFGYLREIAAAIDRLGFGGALLPTGPACVDGWTTAAALAPLTERMKFLVALRPGIVTPAMAARQATAFDRISNGRLLLNVVTGGDPSELAVDGQYLDHDERYAQCAEFLALWRRLFGDEPVTFSGKYVSSRNGRLEYKPIQRPYPPLWFGGSSPAGIEVAAEHVDTYLTWGEPPAQVAEKLDTARARAAARGRSLRFCMRLHLIVRETDDLAWAEADRLISRVTDEKIAEAQRRYAAMDSVGQQRQAAMHGGRRDRLEISPNLWAGVGLVRHGVGVALVGSPQTVAARLREYQALGIGTIIASGYPHLEEAYRVAELLFPELGIVPAGRVAEAHGRDFRPAVPGAAAEPRVAAE